MERQAQASKLTFPELFEKFLLNNNAFSQFCNNLLIQESLLLSDYCEEVDPFDYIEEAFIWYDTNEGYNFWYALDLKWNKIYEENKMG